jgi:hypothetical protein
MLDLIALSHSMNRLLSFCGLWASQGFEPC